jgi:hypothetical protein
MKAFYWILTKKKPGIDPEWRLPPMFSWSFDERQKLVEVAVEVVLLLNQLGQQQMAIGHQTFDSHALVASTKGPSALRRNWHYRWDGLGFRRISL